MQMQLPRPLQTLWNEYKPQFDAAGGLPALEVFWGHFREDEAGFRYLMAHLAEGIGDLKNPELAREIIDGFRMLYPDLPALSRKDRACIQSNASERIKESLRNLLEGMRSREKSFDAIMSQLKALDDLFDQLSVTPEQVVPFEDCQMLKAFVRFQDEPTLEPAKESKDYHFKQLLAFHAESADPEAPVTKEDLMVSLLKKLWADTQPSRPFFVSTGDTLVSPYSRVNSIEKRRVFSEGGIIFKKQEAEKSQAGGASAGAAAPSDAIFYALLTTELGLESAVTLDAFPKLWRDLMLEDNVAALTSERLFVGQAEQWADLPLKVIKSMSIHAVTIYGLLVEAVRETMPQYQQLPSLTLSTIEQRLLTLCHLSRKTNVRFASNASFEGFEKRFVSGINLIIRDTMTQLQRIPQVAAMSLEEQKAKLPQLMMLHPNIQAAFQTFQKKILLVYADKAKGSMERHKQTFLGVQEALQASCPTHVSDHFTAQIALAASGPNVMSEMEKKTVLLGSAFVRYVFDPLKAFLSRRHLADVPILNVTLDGFNRFLEDFVLRIWGSVPRRFMVGSQKTRLLLYRQQSKIVALIADKQKPLRERLMASLTPQDSYVLQLASLDCRVAMMAGSIDQDFSWFSRNLYFDLKFYKKNKDYDGKSIVSAMNALCGRSIMMSIKNDKEGDLISPKVLMADYNAILCWVAHFYQKARPMTEDDLTKAHLRAFSKFIGNHSMQIAMLVRLRLERDMLPLTPQEREVFDGVVDTILLGVQRMPENLRIKCLSKEKALLDARHPKALLPKIFWRAKEALAVLKMQTFFRKTLEKKQVLAEAGSVEAAPAGAAVLSPPSVAASEAAEAAPAVAAVLSPPPVAASEAAPAAVALGCSF